MQSLKILTFNWHDPYLYLLGQTAQDIHVCDWMRRADGTQGWDYQKRPLRDNLTLIKDPAEAIAGLTANAYDLAIAHTLQDIKFLNDFDIPAIFLTHNALHNDGMGNQVAMSQIRSMVAEFVNKPNRLFAAISQMKLDSWGLDGVIIRPGIDVADYGGYTGEVAAAVAVGNLFPERDFMLGFSALSEALENLPHQFVGENPRLPDARKAENWDDLKTFYRTYRVYANATVEAFEDGYNLGMLEAMSTGAPVVTMKNATSPIVDGVNGYVCDTPEVMRTRVSELLKDLDLAKQMGEAARKTVETDFSVGAFTTAWMDAFNRCLSGSVASTAPREKTENAFKLDVSPSDMYAYDENDVNDLMAEPDKVVVAKAKIDRYGGALMIDFVLVRADTGKQAVWAGFQAQVSGDKLNVEFPPYLTKLREDIRGQIEQVLVRCVEESMKPEYAEVPQLHVNLGETASLVSRVGNDRITPGDVRADIYLHHAKRYGFASQFCEGKDVVDVASGTGYGSKILSRRANSVLALDLEADPLRYGRLTFDSDKIKRANADMRSLPVADNSADTIVCFEAIEHITEHQDFVREVHRVLREEGQFVVSTPNLDVYGLPENDNPFHVGMLTETDFTSLLGEFFEDVVCVSQERASGNRAFYDYFNFTDDPKADKEIHVAVCSKPRRLSPPSSKTTAGRARGAGEPTFVEDYGGAGQRSGGESGSATGDLHGTQQKERPQVLGQLSESPQPDEPKETPTVAVSEGPVFSTAAEINAFLSQWEGPVRMNLGCGPDNRAGYINVDAYVDNADLKMDIFKLPLPDNSVDEIFSSHMLEHLGKFEVPQALQEWHRVLKPTGKLQLNLPDLEWVVQQWIDLPEDKRWGWPLDTLFGLQTHPGEFHKTGFTADRAEKILKHVGFGSVQTSWSWSHGMRCIWVDAEKTQIPQLKTTDLVRFAPQFMKNLSDIVPYSETDCLAFFARGDWRVGSVSFERLPMDGSNYTINVALKQVDSQMVLQCLRLFSPDSNPVLWFPSYLQNTDKAVQAEIGDKVGAAFRSMMNEPQFKGGQFVFARFGEDGEVGGEQDGERVIPGLTDMSLYIPHIKRYLFAQTYCDGKQVLDAGCGAGYGTKLLSQVAHSVHGIDIAEDALAFCKKTYASENITWERGDVRELKARDVYDVVTSFEVIERLERDDIPKYLEGLHAALKPDGVALISTPNRLVAQQWDKPHHHTEMTREEFEGTLSEYFDVEAVLGQVTWSQDREVSGQSYLSRRVTDDDDMFVAVCRALPSPEPPRASRPAKGDGEQVSRGAGEKERKAKTQVDIVIPLYNKAEYTKACLESLEATRGEVPFRVILVDNGSTDGTSVLLEAWQDRAEVLRPGVNLGFAKGNNLGASYGDSPYVLFLNNDTVAEAGWLDRMVAEMDANPDIGIAGAKLLYPNRMIQHAGLEIINGVPDHVYRNAPEEDSQANVARDLDMITGACLMIRRELFETLGGFDTGYVNGVEDVDLCLRVRDRGFRVRYVPEAVLEHHEGTSAGRYDHVQPNLQKFAERFQGRFDGNGQFVPVVSATDLTSDDDQKRPLRGCWEGTQFVRHSLAIVNARITSELLKNERLELRLIPYEAPTFGPEEDPETYVPIAKALQHTLTGLPDFHVRHKWPPDFAAPAAGHWVMIQPWEFGRIPTAWIDPIRTEVDEVWVPSFYAKQCYVDSGIEPDRVQVVPNGVDCERFRPDTKPFSLATDKTFKFLFVGGTIYRKGIDVLLNAYREAFSPDDDVCLVVQGTGDETFYKGQASGALIREIQGDPNAPEVLYLTDELSDQEIVGLYTACDCLVHPYRGEGFGIPVAEAMACDLPVIVTRGGATDDFCVEDTAYFVEADRRDIAFTEETAGQSWLLEPQADSLIEQMNYVLEHPEDAAEKGKLGGDHVRENLTWKQAADRAVERLEIVCSDPIRRTITLPGNGASFAPVPVLKPHSVDCLVLTSGTRDLELAEHNLDKYTTPELIRYTVQTGEADLPIGAFLNSKIPEMTTDYVLLMRDDSVVTEGWLDVLLETIEEDDSIAIVVPAIPNGHGDQGVEARYTSKKKELQKFARRRRVDHAGEVVDVESVEMACVLVRRELLIELGGFEATFRTDAFIDDLIRRGAQKGYRTVCALDACVHVDPSDSSIEQIRERKAALQLAKGDRHRLDGDHDAALDAYRAALDLKDDYVEAALICSATLLEMDRPEEAAKPFEVLIEKYPDSARIQNYLGRCLYRSGKLDEAKVLFERALELMPAFAEAQGNLAVLLWEQGRLDEAVEHMGAAAELAPNDPDTLFNIGMIYAQLGQGLEAIDALTSYMRVSPEDNDSRVHLAALLIDNDRESDGLSELEHVLSEVPDHADATRVLKQLEMLIAANEARGTV